MFAHADPNLFSSDTSCHLLERKVIRDMSTVLELSVYSIVGIVEEGEKIILTLILSLFFLSWKYLLFNCAAYTVNPEIFVRILFSRMPLKDIY